MPVAVRLRYVEDVYGKNAGAEQRDYYRQHTAAAAVILFSHLAGYHVPAAVQYGGYLIVGNFVGTQALAAVGATSSFVQLLVGLFVGLCSGAGVIIAQSFARGTTMK